MTRAQAEQAALQALGELLVLLALVAKQQVAQAPEAQALEVLQGVMQESAVQRGRLQLEERPAQLGPQVLPAWLEAAVQQALQALPVQVLVARVAEPWSNASTIKSAWQK